MMTDSTRVTGREPCPKCREQGKDTRGDNLIKYGDGSAKCFACGYRDEGPRAARVAALLTTPTKDQGTISLPADAERAIDHEALTWLSKYGITRDEIIDHDLRWSPSMRWLVFPIRDASGILLAYQARTFGLEKAKWWTKGPVRDILHIIGFKKHGVDSPLVIVEDIISAIKVSRYTRSMPLFGSQMGIKQFARLKYVTKEVLFWLDADKFKESLRFDQRAHLIGLKSAVIYTQKDPKEYDLSFISSVIDNARLTKESPNYSK